RAHRHLGRHGKPGPLAARGRGAARKTQPMHLADHRVAGDAAQRAGNLAGRQPFGPKVLELLDAVVGPIQLRHLAVLPRSNHKISYQPNRDSQGLPHPPEMLSTTNKAAPELRSRAASSSVTGAYLPTIALIVFKPTGVPRPPTR